MEQLNNYAAPKFRALKSSWDLLTLFFTLFGFMAQAQNYWQMPATGYNADVVANGNGTAQQTATHGVDNGQYVFASEDWVGIPTGSSYGLPADGVIISADIDGLTYQIPSYDGNNSLRLEAEGEGTLELETPTAATRLYVLGTSGQGESYLYITVTFTDDSTQEFDGKTMPDWFNSNALPIEAQGLGRADFNNSTYNFHNTGNSNPRLYRMELMLDSENWEKEIKEVTFQVIGGSGNGNVLNVMALSATDDTSVPSIEYCTPGGTNSDYYINNFTAIGNGDTNIENLGSGNSNGGYGNFTDMMVTAYAGGSISFNAEIEGDLTSGFRIWVDWDNDGQFDTNNEVAFISSNFRYIHTGSISVPADAAGNYRMRIVSSFGSSLGNENPCSTAADSAEYEDYTISIFAPCDETNYYISYVYISGPAEGVSDFNETGFDTDDKESNTNIENEVTTPGYGNYSTSKVYTIDRAASGEEFSFQIKAEPVDPNLTYNYKVWVDRNFDNVFSNDGWGNYQELIIDQNITGANAANGLTGTFNVNDPVLNNIISFCDIDAGLYSLRIILTVTGACGEEIFGETEDYTLNIINDCAGRLSIDGSRFDQFTFYPNPAGSEINLNAASVIESVQVYNLLGQKVIETAPNATQTQINTDSLPIGIYMMKVSIGGVEKTFKVVRK